MSKKTARFPSGLHPVIHARRWQILAVLAVSLLIITIDTTILNVALPSLARDLPASTSQLQWIVDAYTLVFAGLLLTAGSLGDRYGRKGALAAGLSIFAAGSVAAALAHSPGQLVAARCIMGVGGAFIMPTTLSIITNVFVEPGERAKAIAIWTGVAGLGVAIGPLAGGFLLSHFSWSAVFAVNIPLCLAALVFVKRLVPSSRHPGTGPLDLPGLALSVVALSSLVYGIIEAPARGWTAPIILGSWGLALATGAGFVAQELRTAHPMLDLTVFKNRRFSAASGSIALVFFALFGSIFVLTAYLQAVLGYTALQAGVRTLPFAGAMMTVSPLSPLLVRRLGTKLVVTAGLVVMAGGMLIAGSSTAHSGYVPIFVAMVVMATGMGLAMAPATESIMGALPKEKAGVGSAINDTTREVGGALGVAILGSIFSSSYASDVHRHLTGTGLPAKLAHAVGESITAGTAIAHETGGITGERLHSTVNQAFIHGMDITLIAAAAVALAGAAVAAILLPSSANTPETVAVDEAPEPALAA